MGKPKILVTNDDSIHAGGIKALVKSLMPLGKITVVAPKLPHEKSTLISNKSPQKTVEAITPLSMLSFFKMYWANQNGIKLSNKPN